MMNQATLWFKKDSEFSVFLSEANSGVAVIENKNNRVIRLFINMTSKSSMKIMNSNSLKPNDQRLYTLFIKHIIQARTKSGQFAPGTSGNPGGRPKDEARVAELARSYTSEAIDTLVDLMRHGKDERVRGTAAQALLDRGWGKPKVEVVNEGGGGYLESLIDANAGSS